MQSRKADYYLRSPASTDKAIAGIDNKVVAFPTGTVRVAT
jgi:hypothetical protein